MKKPTKFLLILLIMELILAILFYTVFALKCGSACDQHSFLNPFGILKENGNEQSLAGCTDECVARPFPFFYLAVDIFMITLLVLVISKIKNKIFK